MDSLRLLVELGWDVNNAGCKSAGPAALLGTSPLWWAAHTGRLDAVKLLVELGADVHARDPEFDSTPLDAAHHKERPDVIEYLVQFAPICEAVRYGGLDRVRALLRENPECVNVRDDEGRTPLHYPDWDTKHGKEIIALLIAHGADTIAKDNDGRTPADQMLQKGRKDLAEVLHRHGGDSARASRSQSETRFWPPRPPLTAPLRQMKACLLARYRIVRSCFGPTHLGRCDCRALLSAVRAAPFSHEFAYCFFPDAVRSPG